MICLQNSPNQISFEIRSLIVCVSEEYAILSDKDNLFANNGAIPSAILHDKYNN